MPGPITGYNPTDTMSYADWFKKQYGLDKGDSIVVPYAMGKEPKPGTTITTSSAVGSMPDFSELLVPKAQRLDGVVGNAPGSEWNWKSLDTSGVTGAGATTDTSKPGFFSRVFTQDNMNKVKTGLDKLAPFASNLVNSFRRPPMPNKPIPYGYTGLQKVNLSNERYAVNTETNAANRSTERNVDGNTAEAIKAFNNSQRFSRISQINERENNTNTQISNAEAQMRQQVDMANTAGQNEYNKDLVEREIARQREGSANWANFGDKVVAIQNEKSKKNTELAKAKVLSTLYDKSGVLKRDNAIGARWKAAGIPDPFGEDYKWLEGSTGSTNNTTEKKAYGGLMGSGAFYKRASRTNNSDVPTGIPNRLIAC